MTSDYARMRRFPLPKDIVTFYTLPAINMSNQFWLFGVFTANQCIYTLGKFLYKTIKYIYTFFRYKKSDKEIPQ